MNRNRALMAGLLGILVVVGWPRSGRAEGEIPKHLVPAAQQVGSIQSDGEIVMAYEAVKLDQLKELVEKGQKDEALQLETKLDKEECRFLERVIYTCREVRILQRPAASLMAYLDHFKSVPPEENLRKRVSSHYGTPEALAMAWQEVTQPPVPTVPSTGYISEPGPHSVGE